MSNAMRLGKRSLAGVAAGALAAGLIPFAVVAVGGSASAAVDGAATVTPVRVTYTGSVQDAVPPAVLTFPDTPTAASNFRFDLQVAPPLAVVTVADANNDDTQVALTGDDTLVRVFDDTLAISANVAGTYSGVIANGTDTATFAFTTTKAPTSMTLSPSTATAAVSGLAEFTLLLKDVDGKQTQPTTVDTVRVSSTATLTPNASPATLAATNVTSPLSDGKYTFYGSLASAGSATITATPLGTLPGTGVTAQSSTLTASGTVQSTPVKGITVSTPANAINGGTFPALTSQVPAGTTSLTIAVDDDSGATSTAGNNLLFKVAWNNGTVNGTEAVDSPIYVPVVVGSTESASFDLALGLGAQVADQAVTITQVTAGLADVTSGGNAVKLTVTQKTPQVYADDLTVSPSGSIVAKLAATTNVTVTVDDSFGTPQSGWTVSAYRGSVSAANFLSSGVTGASGEAAVTVTSASTAVDGTSETYVFQAVSATGTTVGSTGVSTLTVKYTTSGAVTSLSVAPSASGSSTCSNVLCNITVAPLVYVPTDGVVGGSGSATQGIYTIATEAASGAITEWANFPITTDPSNASTVTTPDGVYVTATQPNTAATAIPWNAGKQSATINGGQTAYIWATKTGIHDVTITSGGLTITAKIVATNQNVDAYNIALAPASQELKTGAFGTATVTITDVFGNPVTTGTAAGQGGVTITAEGAVRLGGFDTSKDLVTDANGQASVTIIADGVAGEGSLAVKPSTNGKTTAAWVAGYKPPTGAPAPVTSAAATVKVTGGSTDQSISIIGERATVRGKPGIRVEGATSGFSEGATVVPYVRFPGQTEYSAGSARPAIDAIGDFVWQRKTGKKIYVYFTNESGDIKSNRVIIPAK